jgi:hypothetical protein
MARIWQKIEDDGHFCHWWQETIWRRVTAMDTVIIAITFILGMVIGLAALVHFARHDTFAGPGTTRHERDELGSLAYRRRAA